MSNYTYIGQSVERKDALEKVLGKALFSGDFKFPGILYAKTLRSPYPHARVLKIVTSKAENLPGVKAIVTAKDVKGTNRFGGVVQDQPVLVAEGEKVKLVGDPVALVAAESVETAGEALDLIHVEYEPLEPIIDPGEALRPDSPKIHEEMESNLCANPWEFIKGDVEKGFKEAIAIVNRTFFTPRQEHAYLETETGMATIDSSGKIAIFTGSQDPFCVRMNVAKALGIPEHQLRIVVPMMGGGFGGKMDVSVQAHLALLVMKTKRPLKMTWTRAESFQISPKRHPSRINMKVGATKEGKLTAMEVDFLCDGGAYASQSPGVIDVLGAYLISAYDIPNVKIQGRMVYTNNPISGAFRGYGGPQAFFAVESAMDMLARNLSIDPVEFRLKNIIDQTKKPNNPFITLDGPVTLKETLEKGLRAVGPAPKPLKPGNKTGRGICFSVPMFDISAAAMLAMKGTGSRIEFLPDGTVLAKVGGCEFGSGITTALAQIVAEELGVKLEKVNMILCDTDVTPKSGPAVASRQTYCCGNSLRLASQELKRRLLERTSQELETTPEMLEIHQGRIYVKEYPERAKEIGEITELCYHEGINLSVDIWFTANHAAFGHTFNTTIVDVEVDEELGLVQVINAATSHDVGQAINPSNVEGQLQGGQAQGLGYAITENFMVEKGVIQATNFAKYLLPLATNMPQKMMAVTVESPYPTGPFGAKGVGEHAMETFAPAVMNAIDDAIALRITQFPATPERVWQGLKEKYTLKS